MPSGLSTAVATSSRPGHQEVVLAEVEGAVEHDVADAQRGEGARDEGAADAGDAAEVGEREQGQATATPNESAESWPRL